MVAISGAASDTKSGAEFEVRTTINKQTLAIRGYPKDPASVARIGEVRVGPREAALLEEFGSLNNRLIVMAQSEGATNAKYSCGSWAASTVAPSGIPVAAWAH